MRSLGQKYSVEKDQAANKRFKHLTKEGPRNWSYLCFLHLDLYRGPGVSKPLRKVSHLRKTLLQPLFAIARGRPFHPNSYSYCSDRSAAKGIPRDVRRSGWMPGLSTNDRVYQLLDQASLVLISPGLATNWTLKWLSPPKQSPAKNQHVND
jgi:hypothetical protein